MGLMPKRAQRLVFTGFCALSLCLWANGGMEGLERLNWRLWRGCGGENATGVHGGFFGVGITVAITVGITVAITVGITNFCI